MSGLAAMKKFTTKKDLLRYLGKNEDDRKLITRMIERGEVRVEGRVYIIEEEETKELENSFGETSQGDLEYLNKEYERLEGLLDYSLRRCYNIMKKRGLVGSEDSYDDFYENITAGYSDNNITAGYDNVAERGSSEIERGNVESGEKDLGSIVKTFGIMKASDLI